MVKNCPECNVQNPDEANFCQGCGNKFELDEMDVSNSVSNFRCEFIYVSHNRFRKKRVVKPGNIFINEDGFIFRDKKGDSNNFSWNDVRDVLYSRSENLTTVVLQNGRLKINGKLKHTIKTEWNSIDDQVAIKKMKGSPQHFRVQVPVIIEEAPKEIKDNKGRRTMATLAFGLVGYAATKGPNVVQTGPIKKTIMEDIGFDVSVHEKGIKMIKKSSSDNLDNIIKIPWDQIMECLLTDDSTIIRSINNDNITLNGDMIALKGLYLIINESMTGLVEKDKGWE